MWLAIGFLLGAAVVAAAFWIVIWRGDRAR